MANILQSLLELFGPEIILSSVSARAAASFSPGNSANFAANLPLAVARPRHISQLGKLIGFCAENHLSIRIRGGNTGWFNAPPPKDAVLLDMSALNRILRIEAIGRTVAVQGGCACDYLRKALAAHNLFLPWLYPSGLATIGGVLAANAWGPESPKYGVASNRALTLKVWDGTGIERVLYTQNCRAPHLDASLPLGNLFCGSRGTLGLIGEAELSLLPMPEACAKILASFSHAEDLANCINSLLERGMEPASLLAFNHGALKLLNYCEPCAWLLALEFYENSCSIQEIVRHAAECVSNAHGIQQPAWGHDVRNWLDILPALLNARTDGWQADSIGCPPDRLSSLLEGIENLARQYGVEIAAFGPLLSGRAQILVFEGDLQERHAFLRDLFILDLVLNGQLESDAMLPASRKEWFAAKRREQGLDMTLKSIFDPAGILPPLDLLAGQ